MSECGDLAKCAHIRRPTSTQRRSVSCDPRTLCVWNDMKGTILEIMHQETSKEVITDTVYNAVKLPLMRNSDFIYADLYGYLEGIVDCIAEDLLQYADCEFLRKLLEGWNKYRFSITLISNLFPILEGVVTRETDCTFVNVGRFVFEDGIFQNPVIRDYVTKSLLGMVEDERRGVLMDRALFNQTCATLKSMNICDDRRYKSFEKKFLEESKFYFKRKCQELLAANDTYEYLSQAETVLRREETRLSFCLQESTARANMLLAESELVGRRLNDIVTLETNGVMEMLMEHKTSELALLYKVARRVLLGKIVISDYVNLYLEKRTGQLLEDIKVLPADSVVDSVLEMGDQMSVMVQSCFSNDKFLKSEVCGAFRRYVTCDERIVLFLAQYTNNMLRVLSRAYAPDVDVKLAKLFKVKSFLPSKDAVHAYHKIYLSGRLLLDGVNSQEELAVMQLQMVLGASVMDVRGMLHDIKRSEILSDMYEKHPKIVRPTSRAPACEFSMKLLSSAHWPLIPPSKDDVLLPARPRCHFINFGTFYRLLSRDRHLVLMPQYGTAEVIVFESEVRRRPSKISFASLPSVLVDLSSSASASSHMITTKTIVCKLEVSTVQMCILSLFNEFDRLTVTEIQTFTKIETALICSALKPLCATKVLLKDEETSQEFDAVSEYRVNQDLDDAHVFKLADKTQTAHFNALAYGHSTLVARQAKTDITILKIMKVNNVLSHDSLVSQTVKILKNTVYLPTSVYITKRIGALIQRNMLKRNPQQYNMYSFK